MSKSSSFTAAFPHPKLTRIEGQPDTISIRHMERELFANAQAVPNALCGVGYTRLLMAEDEYDVAFPVDPFPLPTRPGPCPQDNPANANGQRNLDRQIKIWEQELEAYKTLIEVKGALRNQILEAVDKTYFVNMPTLDPRFGVGQVSPHALLQNLLRTYGTMTNKEIDANRNLLEDVVQLDGDVAQLWVRIQRIRCGYTFRF